MATQVLMPQLGLTMTEGVLTDWAIQEGQAVHKGDLLFNVENDKATLPVEAQAEGILANIRVKPMETVPVGTVLAWILAEGEKAEDFAAPAAAAPIPEAAPAPKAETARTPTAAPAAAASTTGGSAPKPAAPRQAAVDIASPASVRSSAADGFVPASPRARSLARKAALDLGGLRGSGPEGAVIERDLPPSVLEENAEASLPLAAPGMTAGRPTAPGADSELVTLPRVGQIGAQRMALSWAEIPQFTLYIDACAEDLIRIHERSKKSGTPVSVTVLLAGLLARALREYPRLNGSWAGDGSVRVYKSVDVGIAMDTPDGLVVPALRNCAGRGFRELAREMSLLAEKGKKRALTADDLSGGTITLSNLGMFGIRRFRAIVNPPQTAIIAVGSIDRRPVELEDGNLEFKPYLELSLTADHRAVDGAYAAKFLSHFKDLIENPLFALD